jgi:Flp pilus assembly protein TadB
MAVVEMNSVTQGADLNVYTATDLECLLDSKSHFRSIRLHIPDLPDAQRQHWQDELAHHYSGCGCGVGNVFGLLGIVAAGSYLAVAPIRTSPWMHGGLAFALVVAFTLIGKLVGWVRSRRRLRAAVKQLGEILDTDSRDSSTAVVDARSS